MSVSATDKSTGKKQSITIRSSGGLSNADVDEMVQEFQEQLSNTVDRIATVQKSCLLQSLKTARSRQLRGEAKPNTLSS